MALPIKSPRQAAAATGGPKVRAAAKKRSSKIASGRRAKLMVLRGRYERTSGGLRADALMRNKRGKVVSKRASAAGLRSFKRVEPWLEAHMRAREALRFTGFVALNGNSLQGKALYVKTRALYAAAGAGAPRGMLPAKASEPAAAPVAELGA